MKGFVISLFIVAMVIFTFAAEAHPGTAEVGTLVYVEATEHPILASAGG